MSIIQSKTIAESAQFRANRQGHIDLIEEFRCLEEKVRQRSEKARPRFEARNQIPPRDRVDLLLDRDSPFLELSTLCGFGMHDDDGQDEVYGGGIIVGIGMVSGVRSMVLASDSGIKGGAMHPMGVEKLIRGQEIALENKLPLIQLVESAGANLARQSEIFVRGGKMFANLAKLSAAGIPVVAVVNGSSTAGGAYQPGLSDYVVMVRGRSHVFLAGPPLLKAATGEIADAEDLGGAQMHCEVSGLGEYMAEDDVDGIRIAREIMASLAWNDSLPMGLEHSFKPPRYDAEELLGVVPVDYRTPYDVREVIARIVDDSRFLEFKPGYGPMTVTGHAAIEGQQVSIIGNNGPIDANGSVKAAQFIQLSCQTNRPLIFLQNTTGYLVGIEAERAGIVKHGAKMIQAVTNANVPKLTLQIGASFGAGHYGMCGRSFEPQFLFSWPNNRISVMGGEQAAKVMTIVGEDGARAQGREPDHNKLSAQAKRIADSYARESTALFATARLWDDGLIDPRDTRRVLAFCLRTAIEGRRRTTYPNSFGVARM
ncbi:acyl-CoA carboxylase subunit beta [Tianweitania sediminis]|uniref:Acyl-CoA carboxylase subunit beta n=1 Tax=Tianweitania sediminis TaxID=1502156 RepID=A0A8J7R1W4_9HYPH|nr:acyl-CoA carboxylase subunit beta [Tianweitania sediminis]